MSTTYISGAVLDQLAEAQVVIDMHLTFSRGGTCGLCQQAEPCEPREEAQALFLRCGRLPRRTPGLTYADTSGWSGRGGWLDEATARRIADAVEEPSS